MPPSATPPEPYRFFFDENVLPVGRHFARTAGHSLYPGHPDLPEVPLGSQDSDWLSVVGRCQLVLITRDKRIRYRPGELEQLRTHAVRGVVLTGKKDLATPAKISLLERRWNAIERLITSHGPGPWLHGLTNNGKLHKIL